MGLIATRSIDEPVIGPASQRHRPAVEPHDVGDVEGPGLEVVGRLPLGAQVRPGDVVDAGAGDVAHLLAGDVGIVDPRERVR